MPGGRRDTLSIAEARRLALAAQGFHRPRPRRVDARHLRTTIHRLGLLQLDYVNVLVPAHYQVPFSRLGPYSRERFDQLVYGTDAFTEQWAHEASIIPVELWPLLRHRMARHRVRPWGFEEFVRRHPRYVRQVLRLVRRRGPVSAEDLPDLPSSATRLQDNWGWGLGAKRQVLEAHFGFGRLAVSERRRNFARRYDLAERLIPDRQFRRRVRQPDAERQLLLRAAASCGIGTASDLADYYRMPIGTARAHLRDLEAEGALRAVTVEGWREVAYRHPRARLPGRLSAAALLSPFDPVVWFRPRAKRLFDFEYRIEIYVPAPKRRWGYYVLPFLLDDRIVARVDLKADRRAGVLRVLSAYAEPEVDVGHTAAALATELRQWSTWLQLGDVHVARKGDLAPALTTALTS